MASYTPNYNLKKPAGTDVVDIDDLNGNMDIIDTQLNSLNSNLTPVSYPISVHPSSEGRATDFGHNSYRIGKIVYCNGFFKVANAITSQTPLFALTGNHYRSEGTIIYRNSADSDNCKVYPIYTEDNTAAVFANNNLPVTSDWAFFNITIIMK